MANTNPMFKKMNDYHSYAVIENPMSTSGVVMNTLILGGLLLVSAIICWNWFALHYIDRVMVAMIAGFIVAPISAIIAIFKPKLSPYLSPVYAIAEGFALGGFSAYVESIYRTGLVLQAVAVTLIIFFVMLFLYQTRVLQATDKFRAVIISATAGIAILYFISWITSFFGFTVISQFLWSSSLSSIVFSVLVCIVASLNFIIDFDNVEKAVQFGFPKYMESYCAMSIMFTLVWLYIEIIRLLLKMKRN